MQCPLDLSQSGRAEDAILTGDMSPIRESGLSRNNSKDSMSDLPDGLVADLEVAMEAGESPPVQPIVMLTQSCQQIHLEIPHTLSLALHRVQYPNVRWSIPSIHPFHHLELNPKVL